MPQSPSQLTDELAVATRLALTAGARVMALRTPELVVDRKAGDEPVTAADREASELIVAGLRAAFPRDAVLSEELPDDGSRLTASRVWMVDPIDGTRDYVAGRTGFAVMIGLVVAGRPVLGVVYEPAADDGGGSLCFGAVGQGAQVARPAGSAPVSLAVSTVASLAAVRLVSSASHRWPLHDRICSAIGAVDELRVGSVGVKLARIAMGERDLYVNPSAHSSLWDSCAPEAILVAAGGRVTDLDGVPLVYGSAELKNRRGIVASNGRVHTAALERIAPLLPPSDPKRSG
jgi:3'(2'), 5'-bisphosphate nucleotidase